MLRITSITKLNPQGHISKIITSCLLAAILYMHVCSVWCALGSGCNNLSITEQQSKSCCAQKQKSSGSNDCQAEHLAFFNATGQYFTDISKDPAKGVYSVSDITTPESVHQISSDHITVVEYNGFHPPPPKAGIRIMIQSFQI